MRNFFAYLLLFLIGFFAASHLDLSTLNLEHFFGNLFQTAPCDQPIPYKIGNIDPRFHISQNQFLQDTKQATNIWNKAMNKNLFEYDPNANLTVNMVFDERQSLETQVNQLQSNLQTQKSVIEPSIQKYNSMIADFKTRLANLNEQITYWNSRGGAPPDVYNQLVQEQNDLKTEADQINAMGQQLNISTQEYNNEVGQLNQTAGNFNSVLQMKPEEGLFNSGTDEIDIYLDVNQNELIHTLAHEFGHALGLQHVASSKSIMYAYTNQTITPSSADLTKLNNLCQGKL